MKLYQLYKKSTKKLRSLKDFIDELAGLLDLTDNFIGRNGLALIRASGARKSESKSAPMCNQQIWNYLTDL